MKVNKSRLKRVCAFAAIHLIVLLFCLGCGSAVDILARPALDIVTPILAKDPCRQDYEECDGCDDSFTNYDLFAGGLYLANSLLWGIWLEDTATQIMRFAMRIR